MFLAKYFNLQFCILIHVGCRHFGFISSLITWKVLFVVIRAGAIQKYNCWCIFPHFIDYQEQVILVADGQRMAFFEKNIILNNNEYFTLK